nr:ISKra4 family transposase [Mesorhizobium amorphae]
MKVWVELVGADGLPLRREIAIVARNVEGARLGDFGLSLDESKGIQRRLQEEFTQFQADQAAQLDRNCLECGRVRSIHDYRSRTVDSLFGVCRMRVPRFRGCACDGSANPGEGRTEALLNGRATPELQRIQAELGSRLSFREAARVLDLFVPAMRPHNHRTVSNRLAKVADQIEKWDLASPYRLSRADGSPVSVFIDGAYIRAVPGYQSRHFEIVMGRVVTKGRPPRQFAASPHVTTGKHDVVRAALRAQGWVPGSDVTVFSDGDVGLQGIVIGATRQPITHILDWFHLSMRLRHIEQAWEGLKCVGNLSIYLRDTTLHVPRLRHLLWSGYVREATRAVRDMLCQLEQYARLPDASNKLKRFFELVSNLQTYLIQNKTSLVDYCQRYWSDHPISSAPAESAANSLVNARMNKKRQMRWSPAGAHRVLQVRAAVADGRLKQAKFALAA